MKRYFTDKEILGKVNQTAMSYSFGKTITQLFEKSVEKYPSRTAIYLGNQSVSYHEFNTKVNQYARHFRKQDLKANDIVGIEMERSYEMLLAVFSVLKAGAAYLPLDPNYPVSRKLSIIRNSRMCFLLTNKSIDYDPQC